MEDYADWTKGALESLGVKNGFLIAHSFGCRVAVKLQKKYAGFFDKMLLTGAAGVVLPRPLSYHIKVRAYRLVKRLAPRFAERRFGSREYRTLSPVMKESYKKIVNEDLRADASRISVPVLIVQGKEDATTPLKEARAYLKVLQCGRLAVMKGGHFAFAEYPLAFNLIAEEYFLNGRKN